MPINITENAQKYEEDHMSIQQDGASPHYALIAPYHFPRHRMGRTISIE